MKMALKAKKEGWLCDAPPSPKPKPEQRLWRPRWQHWKVPRDAKKKKKDPHVTHLLAAQDTAVLKAAQISPPECSRRNQLDPQDRVLPDHRVSHGNEDDNMLVFIVMSRPASTRSSRLCRGLMPLRHQRQHPDQTWWREEGIHSAASWICHFGCCQQNWDQLSPAG